MEQEIIKKTITELKEHFGSTVDINFKEWKGRSKTSFTITNNYGVTITNSIYCLLKIDKDAFLNKKHKGIQKINVLDIILNHIKKLGYEYLGKCDNTDEEFLKVNDWFYYKDKKGNKFKTTYANQQAHGFKFKGKIDFKDVLYFVYHKLKLLNIDIIEETGKKNIFKYHITYKCNKCGYKNKTSLSSIYYNENWGCAKCKRKAKYTINEVKEEIHNKFPDVDTSKIIYKSVNHPIILICKKHGEFITTLQKIRNSTTHICKQCAADISSSYMERYIETFLLKNNINHERQIAPDSSWNFYRPDFINKTDKWIIECDGLQHFENNDYLHADFEKIRQRDEFVTSWCKNNNYRLIRYSSQVLKYNELCGIPVCHHINEIAELLYIDSPLYPEFSDLIQYKITTAEELKNIQLAAKYYKSYNNMVYSKNKEHRAYAHLISKYNIIDIIFPNIKHNRKLSKEFFLIVAKSVNFIKKELYKKDYSLYMWANSKGYIDKYMISDKYAHILMKDSKGTPIYCFNSIREIRRITGISTSSIDNYFKNTNKLLKRVLSFEKIFNPNDKFYNYKNENALNDIMKIYKNSTHRYNKKMYIYDVKGIYKDICIEKETDIPKGMSYGMLNHHCNNKNGYGLYVKFNVIVSYNEPINNKLLIFVERNERP